jgi:PAS domain S-box-containing protein
MLASVFLFLISVICAALVVAAYQNRRIPAALPLALLLIALALWSFGYGIELASRDLDSKQLWAKIQYIGIVVVPASWMAFVLQYGRSDKPLRRRTWALLGIEPTLVLTLIWTNDRHVAFYQAVELINDPILGPTRHILYGPAFWLHASYAYLLLLISAALLVRLLLRAPHGQRRTISSMLIAAIIPWIGNMLYLSGLSRLDLTPFTFMVSSVIFAWSLFRLGLLDLVPVARDTLIESMSDGVLVLDLQNRVADLNPAALQIMGRTRPQVIGLELSSILSTQAKLIERYRDVTWAHDEIEIVRADHAAYWFDIRISPLNDATERQRGRLVVLRDITEQRAAEAALRAAKDAAELASRAKSAFLAHVSHELRTPLNAIIGYSELLLLESQEQGLSSFTADLQRISDSGQHLLAMIADMIDLTQLDSGTVDLFIERIELAALISGIGTASAPMFHKQHNQLIIDCPPELTIYSDAAKLRRALLHVLHNAAKFTEHGTVTLRLRRRPFEPQPDVSALVVEIIDTGIGMTPQQIDQLFQALTPADAVMVQNRKGMGIGLATVRKLCELLHGSVTIAAHIGQGTTCTIIVPDAQELHSSRKAAESDGRL